MDSIGARIVFLRRSLGLTQNDFAEKIGYSASYVSRMEHGLIDNRKNDKSDTSDASNIPDKPNIFDIPYGHERFLIKICMTFGIDLKWLIGESDELPEVIREAQKTSGNDKEQAAERGQRLKQVRTEHKLTVRQFADIIKASTNTVVNTEKGHREITKQYAKRIEDAFGVSADWILYGDESCRNYPLTDRMTEYLKRHEEVRKYVWQKMQENDKRS